MTSSFVSGVLNPDQRGFAGGYESPGYDFEENGYNPGFSKL
jgi:hypothetical protein